MTPRDLENEVMTPKSLYVIDITLTPKICEFDKPRPHSFSWNLVRKLKKTMTPRDLENRIATSKS